MIDFVLFKTIYNTLPKLKCSLIREMRDYAFLKTLTDVFTSLKQTSIHKWTICIDICGYWRD